MQRHLLWHAKWRGMSPENDSLHRLDEHQLWTSKLLLVTGRAIWGKFPMACSKLCKCSKIHSWMQLDRCIQMRQSNSLCLSHSLLLTWRTPRKTPKQAICTLLDVLCQRFFAAGKGCGLQDACRTVFFRCADYIATKQPRKFVLENVKRILSRLSQRWPHWAWHSQLMGWDSWKSSGLYLSSAMKRDGLWRGLLSQLPGKGCRPYWWWHTKRSPLRTQMETDSDDLFLEKLLSGFLFFLQP